tara:strand:- start:1803 stop:2540 length:738 start_codon:yes stop_codon:yes gene_type:complete
MFKIKKSTEFTSHINMKKNENEKEVYLNNLDKNSEVIGMGGFQTNEDDQEGYKKRMQQRKEIQAKRLKERDKEKGLIIVFTGNGKGKTTASLGLALRSIGHGHQVAIIQFIKGGWSPGEVNALSAFGEQLKWHALGEGFTWETQNRSRDKELVSTSWNKALTYLKDESYKLVILDEINVAIKLGYISLEKILIGIKKRPPLTHVVLTGRSASKDLIATADLVTEMKLLHHPFREQGIKAQQGIEY